MRWMVTMAAVETCSINLTNTLHPWRSCTPFVIYAHKILISYAHESGFITFYSSFKSSDRLWQLVSCDKDAAQVQFSIHDVAWWYVGIGKYNILWGNVQQGFIAIQSGLCLNMLIIWAYKHTYIIILKAHLSYYIIIIYCTMSHLETLPSEEISNWSISIVSSSRAFTLSHLTYIC